MDRRRDISCSNRSKKGIDVDSDFQEVKEDYP